MHINGLSRPAVEKALQQLLPELQRRLPFWVSVLLVLLVAWTLASLTWEVLPRPKAATPIYTSTADTMPPAAAEYNRLADMHLFGTANPAANANAPETTLALTLRGIVAANRDHQESRAIIAAGGNEQNYGVGAQLPGGAVIQAIYPDRVLLSLNGRLEALRLPKASGMDNADNTTTPLLPTVVYGSTLPPTTSLNQLRNDVVNHPERLLDIVRAMPVMANGKLVGYRVFPVGNSTAFTQFGLKPGDVVTAVNGLPLDNPAESMRILGSLKTSDQISITLTRNGQQQTQVLQLQNPNN